MTNPTTRLAALGLLACLVAFAPAASATHDYNRCTNETGSDTWIAPLGAGLGVGVDGPLTDGNGLQVCVGQTTYSVESTLNPPGWDGVTPPPGTPADLRVFVRVCSSTDTHTEECDESGGGNVILGWTGLILLCDSVTDICVWVNGTEL